MVLSSTRYVFSLAFCSERFFYYFFFQFFLAFSCIIELIVLFVGLVEQVVLLMVLKEFED